MSEVKRPGIQDIARPLHGSAGRVELSAEEARRLGLSFELSPEARRDIEELEREQREALWRLRFAPPLGAAA